MYVLSVLQKVLYYFIVIQFQFKDCLRYRKVKLKSEKKINLI